MPSSILRERRVQLSLATPHPIPFGLTMTDEQDATDSEPNSASLAIGELDRGNDYRCVAVSPRK